MTETDLNQVKEIVISSIRVALQPINAKLDSLHRKMVEEFFSVRQEMNQIKEELLDEIHAVRNIEAEDIKPLYEDMDNLKHRVSKLEKKVG